MSILVQDVKVAARQLWRRPGFTLTAVLTLGIGIGVNGVAFTVVNGLLFKGAAFRTAEGMGRIVTTPGGDEGGNASLEEYRRFVDATDGALDLAAEGRSAMAWRHDGTTQTAWVLLVSSNYFSLVGPRPLAGEVNVARAIDGVPSVVIGERFWRRKLNAPPLAGLTLHLNGTDVSVAGVLPESFTGPAGLYSPDVWLPLDALELFTTSAALQRRDYRWLFLLGRLQPAVSVPEVQGRLDAAVSAMARDWPDSHRQRGARFRLFKEGNSELRGLSAAATVGMGIIGLVLLLACFNVANLLLARAVERERDMGIRAAVGARPSRLMRLMVTEGFLIAGLAGAAAVVLSRWTQTLVGSFAIPIEQPQHIDLAPDAAVIGFILLLVLVAGVLPGIWPAVTVARVDVIRVLGSQSGTSAGGRPSRLRRWLVGAQVAGSTAFLAIAGLLVQSYGSLSLVDLGFERDRLLVAELEPASHGYDEDRSERYVASLVARVRALPGVADVAVADRAPFFIGFQRLTPVSPAGAACDTGACPAFATLAVGPGYFRTMGIALISGREFDVGGDGSEVIINQPLARQLWPDGRGPGETLRIGERGVNVTVIGVTAKTHTRGLDREQPTLYVPLGRDDYSGRLSVVARTAIAPGQIVRPLVEASQALDPHVAMLSVKTMEQRMAVQLWPFRTISWLFGICGALALVLSTVGLAGMVVHAVSRRLREFGVRVSLGATPGDLASEVLRSSAGLLIPGLVTGTLLAGAAARLIQAAFIGVDVLNPVTYLAVALFEGLVVGLACIGPALRASRVDPLVALRAE
ncbi:MAG TPA: ABC transporter permease [Vicinamibacterales bacterium]|nr:ABC transporter permease [Vicinamibacterales bacterium]